MPVNTHPFTHEDVMAYLDGELSPATAAEMTAHLAQCRTCQNVAADLQSVSRQLSGWAIEPYEADSVPSQIAAAWQTRVAEKAKHLHVRPWRALMGHPWVLVAASLLVLLPALMVFKASQAPMADKLQQASIEASAPIAETALSLDTRSATTSRAPKTLLNASPSAPLVVHTAELRLTARTFDSVRTDLDHILAQFGGHIAQLNVASPTNEARSLTATLRVPAPQLDATLTALRRLGHVDGESQRGEEVTQQSVDLEARLINARHTEERLTQILATRTGKLSDVLEVEQKLAQVRGEIERDEAEQKSLNNRISLATIALEVTEDYRAPLTGTTAPSVGTRLSNSAANGLHVAFDAIIGVAQIFLTAGPTLLLAILILGLPAYFLWKKHRR